MGGTYHQEGDYLIPNLSLPDEPEYWIGKYRRMCRMNSIRSCGKEIVLTELVYV
ncbi:TnpV protein [Agathobaculum butyriciproducens]